MVFWDWVAYIIEEHIENLQLKANETWVIHNIGGSKITEIISSSAMGWNASRGQIGLSSGL